MENDENVLPCEHSLSHWVDTICIWVVKLFILRPQLPASPALLEEKVCSYGKAGAGKHLHHSSGTTKCSPLPNSSWGESGDTWVFSPCWIHQVLDMCFTLFSDFSEISSAPQRQSTEWQLLIVLDSVTKPCHQDSQHKQISTLQDTSHHRLCWWPCPPNSITAKPDMMPEYWCFINIKQSYLHVCGCFL